MHDWNWKEAAGALRSRVRRDYPNAQHETHSEPRQASERDMLLILGEIFWRFFHVLLESCIIFHDRNREGQDQSTSAGRLAKSDVTRTLLRLPCRETRIGRKIASCRSGTRRLHQRRRKLSGPTRRRVRVKLRVEWGLLLAHVDRGLGRDDERQSFSFPRGRSEDTVPVDY